MKLKALITLAAAAILASSVSYARPSDNHSPAPLGGRIPEKRKVDKPWKHRADKNNDGLVNNGEGRDWAKSHPGWVDRKAQVNKDWEKRMDDNKDGVLTKHEVRDQHKDFYNAGKVNKEWESQADTNKDGYVDKTELDTWGEAHGNPDKTVNKEWEYKADRNKDGIVDEAEAKQYNSTLPVIEGGVTDASSR